jgi:periplasmic protein CpxP/Spy
MKTPSLKIMTIAIVLLLLVNVAMLVFILNGRSHHGDKSNPRQSMFEMMSKELNMSDQQKNDFKKLREDHFNTIKPVFDSIHALRKSLFNQIKADNMNDSTVNHYSAMIADQQAIIDKMTISHFRKVRALFSGEQQQKYDDFVEKIFAQRQSRRNQQNHDRDSSK